MLKQRIITALILLLIVLGTLFLAPAWAWGALSLVAMALAAREWGLLVARPPRAAGLAALLVAAGASWLVWREPGAVGPVALMLTTGLLAIDLLAWLGHALPAVLRARLPRARQPARLAAAADGPDAALAQAPAETGDAPGTMLAFAALSLFCLWLALYELRLIDPLLLLSAMAVVWLADIGAYFAGRAFGRTKLAPRVSPGKTREGAYGGLALVLLAALAVVQWIGDPAVMPLPLASRFGLAATLVLLALIVALSIVGDLYESLLKRHRGVKDSGTLFPGHGGIFDRVDALVPTMPAFLLLIRIATP